MSNFNLIDLTINEKKLVNSIKRAKENGFVVPTYAQMKNPSLIPSEIKEKLKSVGRNDLNPLNLFRINWHNEPKETGGLFGEGNYVVLPKEVTGVDAKIVAISGKYFPTGSHKVGAAFSCLAPRLVTGQFDPTTTKAVWP